MRSHLKLGQSMLLTQLVPQFVFILNISFLFLVPLTNLTSTDTVAPLNFAIPPYILQKDSRTPLLKFQAIENDPLVLEVFIKDHEGVRSLTSSLIEGPGKMQTFSLSSLTSFRPLDCGQEFSFTLTDGRDSRRSYHSPFIPLHPCKDTQELTFGFISDTQQGTLRDHQKIVRVLKKNLGERMNFLLHTGDIVQMGGLNFLWKNFFKQAAPYLTHLPLITAVGNHEYYFDSAIRHLPNNFQRLFRWSEEGENQFLSYVFPQFTLLVLNTNFSHLSRQEIAKQWHWLESSLQEESRQQRKVIIAGHHSPFSSGFMSKSKEAKILRKKLVPLLEKYQNVPLVLTGHEHLYERSIKAGTHYVVAGPAGGTRGMVIHTNPHRQTVKTRTPTFTLIKVSRSQIHLMTRNVHNTLIDELNIPLSASTPE